MTTGTQLLGPVGRDWLPTPHPPAPAVGVPAPRVGSDRAGRREDHEISTDVPFVVVLPSQRTAQAYPVVVVPAPRTELVVEEVALEVDGRSTASEPGRSSGKAGRRTLGALLNLAALLGVVMLSVTVYAATHQLHPLVVRSGSMEPLIHTGSMVLVKTIPASQIRVGDVVAVQRPDGVTVTHRVVSLSRSGDLAQLTLKGDANKTQDPAPVPVASAGRLVWTAPLLGRIAAFTATARGGFALGCVFGAVVLSLRRRSS